MKKLLLFILSLTIILSAAIVPVDRARKVAENYYKNYAPVSEKGHSVQKILTKEYMGQPTWYVVQFTEGWVIVAADDEVRPILGYSYESTVDEDLYNMQNPFVSRFSYYDKQIVHGVRENGYIDSDAKRKWKDIENGVFPQNTAKVSKGPLLETTWGQGYPFNAACPPGCPTGPVATAMAQIIRYWSYPDYATGTVSYTDSSGDSTGNHSVNFYTQEYLWYNMLSLDGSTYTQAEVEELSKFSYHLGVSVYTDYNTDGSGAFLADAQNAFINNWQYSEANRTVCGTITDPSAFYTNIQTEINSSCPVLWSGYSESSGHAFVLDGYNIDTASNTYEYHFNWGWGGTYDGWFSLVDLTPGISDYSMMQEFVYDLEISYPLPGLYWSPPAFTNTEILDGENVFLEWEWSSSYSDFILSGIELYRNNELLAVFPDSITSFTDYNLSEGFYNYQIAAIYGPPYYTDNYSAFDWTTCHFYADISPDPDYPLPIGLTAITYYLNRQKIDLVWYKPYIGTPYILEDFEKDGITYDPVSAGWTQKGAAALPALSWSDQTGTAPTEGWCYINADYSPVYEQYVFSGRWSAYCDTSTNNPEFSYMISSDQYIVTEPTELTFWLYSVNSGTKVHVITYTGDFTEPDPSSNITVMSTIKQPIEDKFEYKSVTLPAGTYRIGIVKENLNGFSIIDRICFGNDDFPDGDQPLSYEVYCNGSLETTMPCTGLAETYESAGFSDGWNEYYVKAVYASGTSLSSKRASAWIDANPVPMFLTGVWDDVNAEVDLDWYAPGHYPPHWFGYQWEGDSWNYISYSTFGAGSLTKVRTYYSAEDFGMSYPVYISSLSAAFYEDAGVEDWASNLFKIAVGTGGEGSEVYLHTSANLTAIEDGTWVDYALPSTLTISEPWFVEVQPQAPTSGTPNVLTFVHEEGVDAEQWNSVVYWTGDATYDAGWYAISYVSPYEYEDWAFLCYGWNDEPVITKNGQPAREPVAFTPIRSNKDITKNEVKSFGSFEPKKHEDVRVLRITDDSKGLDTYNIYRNGSLYSAATGTSYNDTAPLSSNEYYITAVYSNPVGESDSTNHVSVGPPPIISLPASVNVTSYAGESSNGEFNIGNIGLGELTYDLGFEYTDEMSQEVYGTDEHFAASLGTFTVTGTGWAYSTTEPVYETAYARVTSSSSGTRNSYLTSVAFDISGLINPTLSYAYLWKGNSATTAYLTAEYSTDGVSYSELIRYDVLDQLTWPVTRFDIPNTTIRVRFHCVYPRASELYAGVDVIQIKGNEQLIDPWFSFESETSGMVDTGSGIDISCGFDATTLTQGEYHGNITIISNDTTNAAAAIPVILTVNPSGIEESLPAVTKLSQNYPNPFNPVTTVNFSIASDTNVKLNIYNTNGQKVSIPVDKFMKRGNYKVDIETSGLSGGMYLYKLEADGKVFTKKMTVVK